MQVNSIIIAPTSATSSTNVTTTESTRFSGLLALFVSEETYSPALRYLFGAEESPEDAKAGRALLNRHTAGSTRMKALVAELRASARTPESKAQREPLPVLLGSGTVTLDGVRREALLIASPLTVAMRC